LRPGLPPALLEVKTPYRRDFENDTHVHDIYIGQCQMGMSTFDVDLTYFVQYRPNGHMNKPELLTIIKLERERDWLETHAPTLEAFWAEVEHWRAHGWQNHPSADKLKPPPEPALLLHDDSDEENSFVPPPRAPLTDIGRVMFVDSSDEGM